jgi:hypothetical protein
MLVAANMFFMAITSSNPRKDLKQLVVEIARFLPEERRQTSSLANYLTAIRFDGTLVCHIVAETRKRRPSASKGKLTHD